VQEHARGIRTGRDRSWLRRPGPRPGSELRPHYLRPLDKHDAQPLGRAVGPVRQQPVAQLAGQLDAGEAGANDGDRRIFDALSDLREAPVEDNRLRLRIRLPVATTKRSYGSFFPEASIAALAAVSSRIA